MLVLYGPVTGLCFGVKPDNFNQLLSLQTTQNQTSFPICKTHICIKYVCPHYISDIKLGKALNGAKMREN